MKICNVVDCAGSATRLGYCGKHYARFKRNGDPVVSGKKVSAFGPNCTVLGCNENALARGLCNLHYTRMRAHGDVLSDRPRKTGNQENKIFAEKTLSVFTDDCIFWPFSTKRGYPKLTGNDGTRHLAHRFVCEKKHGPAPSSDSHAAHSCGNGHLGCINWRHLRWATPVENMADRIVHGTSNRGSRHGISKLKESDIPEIRRQIEKGRPQKEVAQDFGVSQSEISDINRGRVWGWLK